MIVFKSLIHIYQPPFQTHVNLNPHVHFKSEEYFPNALKFLPERWMRGGESSDIHPYLLTPFGHGVRTCAGNICLLRDTFLIYRISIVTRLKEISSSQIL
jgi:hypothetical protein